MLGFRALLHIEGGAVLGGVSAGVMASKMSIRPGWTLLCKEVLKGRVERVARSVRRWRWQNE